MPFRTGTPYPSMPVLGNVVRRFIPGLRCAHPGLFGSCRPIKGLVFRQTCALSGHWAFASIFCIQVIQQNDMQNNMHNRFLLFLFLMGQLWYFMGYVCFFREKYKNATVRKNMDQSQNQPLYGAARVSSVFILLRRDKPGWAQRNPGDRHLSTLLYDRHRVVGVSVETDGIVVAMTFPGHHCIGEYAIPYRNAISVNAGLGQCSSMSYTQGYAALTLGCLALAAP